MRILIATIAVYFSVTTRPVFQSQSSSTLQELCHNMRINQTFLKESMKIVNKFKTVVVAINRFYCLYH